MLEGFSMIVFPAGDLQGSKTLLSTFLRARPYVDQPHYVGYRIGELEVGLDPHASQTVAYRTVMDIVKERAILLRSGAQAVKPIRDVGNGKLVATFKDASGNIFGLIQLP